MSQNEHEKGRSEEEQRIPRVVTAALKRSRERIMALEQRVEGLENYINVITNKGIIDDE